MSLVEKIKTFVIEKKFLVLGAVLTLALAVGGLMGWQKYSHTQSPEFFVEQLNAALVAHDLATLATLVDFKTLTEDVAQQILAQPMPSKFSTPKQTKIPLLAEDIQIFLLEALAEKEETAPAGPIDGVAEALAPLAPLPTDFAKQIAGKFFLQARTQNGAITAVRFNHPRLEKDFTLHFYLNSEPDWKITRLINSKDLVQAYIDEDTTLEGARKKAHDLQRAKDQKRIDQQFNLEECTAFIHTPTGQKTPILTVRIRGYNNGPFVIRNMTFDTTVHAHYSEGELTFKHKINTAARLSVGTTLEDSYRLELDTEGKDAKILIGSDKTLCEAKVSFMTLDNGTMLYINEDKTNMEKALPQK